MIIKVRQIFLTLVIYLISSIIVDGGKTIMFTGNNLQIHLYQAHHKDLEIPHQHNYNKSGDEKLLTLSSFDLSCSYNKLLKSPYNYGLKLRDYSGLIWQPPKSLKDLPSRPVVDTS